MSKNSDIAACAVRLQILAIWRRWSLYHKKCDIWDVPHVLAIIDDLAFVCKKTHI